MRVLLHNRNLLGSMGCFFLMVLSVISWALVQLWLGLVTAQSEIAGVPCCANMMLIHCLERFFFVSVVGLSVVFYLVWLCAATNLALRRIAGFAIALTNVIAVGVGLVVVLLNSGWFCKSFLECGESLSETMAELPFTACVSFRFGIILLGLILNVLYWFVTMFEAPRLAELSCRKGIAILFFNVKGFQKLVVSRVLSGQEHATGLKGPC